MKRSPLSAAQIAANITRLAKLAIERDDMVGANLEHYLTTQQEGEDWVEGTSQLDYCDAVFQCEQFAEEAGSRGESALLRALREFLIEAGFYRIMPQEEIDRTYVSGGKKWNFKLRGVAYTADYPYCAVTERPDDGCSN